MPYIDQDSKDHLERGGKPVMPGELTYLITTALIQAQKEAQPIKEVFAAVQGHIDRFLPDKPRYANYAIVLGCLDSARREHVRRTGRVVRAEELALRDFQTHYYNEVIAPYEDKAIEKNGDVYS